MRSGTAHGSTNKVELKSDGAKLFTALPRVPEVIISLPTKARRGAAVKLNIKVNIKGKYPFHITIVKPDGRIAKALVSNIFAPANHTVPFAFNDQAGTWKVIIKDVITGKTTTKNIRIK